jgi:hypothetical protein
VPAICQVARCLIHGHHLTHDAVRAAIERFKATFGRGGRAISAVLWHVGIRFRNDPLEVSFRVHIDCADGLCGD